MVAKVRGESVRAAKRAGAARARCAFFCFGRVRSALGFVDGVWGVLVIRRHRLFWWARLRCRGASTALGLADADRFCVPAQTMQDLVVRACVRACVRTPYGRRSRGQAAAVPAATGRHRGTGVHRAPSCPAAVRSTRSNARVVAATEKMRGAFAPPAPFSASDVDDDAELLVR